MTRKTLGHDSLSPVSRQIFKPWAFWKGDTIVQYLVKFLIWTHVFAYCLMSVTFKQLHFVLLWNAKYFIFHNHYILNEMHCCKLTCKQLKSASKLCNWMWLFYILYLCSDVFNCLALHTHWQLHLLLSTRQHKMSLRNLKMMVFCILNFEVHHAVYQELCLRLSTYKQWWMLFSKTVMFLSSCFKLFILCIFRFPKLSYLFFNPFQLKNHWQNSNLMENTGSIKMRKGLLFIWYLK